ncbi:hypothetical protein N5P37_008367 [Trichoderma harzianum]|nr:hypothetical protein N5P37_008367 [Trichoderma harzianum]
MLHPIADTGISVVYEAENSTPVVDIVFVHGLQGHPFKTWAYRHIYPDVYGSSAPTTDRKGKRNAIRRFTIQLRRNSSNTESTHDTEPASGTLPKENAAFKHVFWPADLLPKECPNSRILVFGYDSKVTKYTAGEVNQNNILSHSKDLLFALSRQRDLDRPLVFVAHSLGGIIVKEMLAGSSLHMQTELRNVVESTKTVVFLGTPHRGSQDVAALGEVVRRIVSSFNMKTTPVILDALGLKTSDLERAQEGFSNVWKAYDFKVKTFQEGLSLAKIGKRVVPSYSSLIGDYREQAETLQANHIEMCRYSGPDDANYRKVGGELHSIYRSIARLKKTDISLIPQKRRHPSSLLSAVSLEESAHIVSESCLKSLWFPTINTRYQSLEAPLERTCLWLFRHKLYQDWLDGTSRHESYGLLWLKGKPGAGKSTIMKEAFYRAAQEQVKSNYRTAAFFFNAKGEELEHTSLGLFQSLLYQLLPGDEENLKRFHDMWHQRLKLWGPDTPFWAESDLKIFFKSMMTEWKEKRTLLFIDGLDECDESSIRHMAYFWRQMTEYAYELGVNLNVCISIRHFPTVTLSNCPEITVEEHNTSDLETYVDYKFQLGYATQVLQWRRLKRDILDKAAGVFLWAVLVVEDMLKSWDDGNGMPYLIKRIADLPQPLEALFANIFLNLESESRDISLSLFQWAILATKPLRLHEWHHIMAFIRQPKLESLSEWRESVNFTESDEQLEKLIRSISRGLVEVKKIGEGDSPEEENEETSIHAGAGSLNLEHGDTRIVQVIHESVRSFFLEGLGFHVVSGNIQGMPIGNGHLSIMATCLDYINIAELDALVNARIRVARKKIIWKNSQYSSDDMDSSSFHPTPYASTNPEDPDLNQRPHEEQLANRKGYVPVFDKLALLDHIPGIDILAWMAEGDGTSAKQMYPGEFPRGSVTHSSGLSSLRLLEDYPALLSYAIFEMFTHARLAAKDGVNIGPFIRRLNDEATWQRFVALREDIPTGMNVVAYALDMGLPSWDVLDAMRPSNCARPPDNGDGNGEDSDKDSSPKLPPLQRRRRSISSRRSVASFSSASSHG